MRTIPDLRAVLSAPRLEGRRIGFVPTMGALHDGHLALVRRARATCDVVVCSIFVNPTQFNNSQDLDLYPRTEDADRELLAGVGADMLFAPHTTDVYPPGFATTIDVGPIAEPLEGATRGSVHFRGVATVVAKLLNIVQPHVAFFGQKDAQQVLVIRRMAQDLDIPVVIETCPTVREADGLALSSRNVRLSPAARAQALGLSAALMHIATRIADGTLETTALLAEGMSVLAQHEISPTAVDYLAIVDGNTLEPLDQVRHLALIAVAAHVGGVRLIDNHIVHLD